MSPDAVSSPLARALPKGRQTRATILEAALSLAQRVGLEGLSIGALADEAGMSKSGVFAHFGSREELQISVIRAYHERFRREVFVPAIAAPRGLPRLQSMIDLWMNFTSAELDSGCIYISGAVEFDDRPGPVRDALVGMVQTWHGTVRRAIDMARECGHLRADVDAGQVLFEILGLILALHYEARLLRTPDAMGHARAGLSQILARHRA